MNAGEVLARWFVHEAERVYASIGEKPEERETRRIAELVNRLAVRNGGTVRPRDLQRANKGKYPTAESAEAALDSLVSAGLGSWREVAIGKQGGRPARVFIPAPHCEADSRQNPTEPNDDEPHGECEQADRTAEGAADDTLKAKDSEVVSAFVGCRVDDAKPNDGANDAGGNLVVVSGKQKAKRKAKPKHRSLFPDASGGLPD